MSSPLAFHNGKFVTRDALHVAVDDTGFVMGVTVAEQMRTFGGRLFRLGDHLDRFERSLAIIGLDVPVARAELESAAQRLVAENHRQLAAGDDLGLCLFATPGPYAAMASPDAGGPMLAMHTYAIGFRTFASKYEQGQTLTASSVPQLPSASLPRELKCRSRMHYYLADCEAAQIEPGSRALMLDTDGSVLEATTANVLIYCEDEGLISPPAERILPGISVAASLEIADRLQIPHTHREISLADFAAAGEAMLTSTSVCILPVVALNGKPIGGGSPGPMYRRLLAGWCDVTGIDVPAQALQFSQR